MSHPHPYYDYKVSDQVAITTLAGPCIAFDEGLADFIHLVRTTTDKDLVITIPPKARLTPAFDRLVDATGCIVLVRESSGGYRDLRTGRWTPEIRPAASNRDDPRIVVSEAHFQQDDLTPLLTVSASIYHRARLTVLGRVAELICAHFMPEGTVLSWARTEPAGAVWDRKTFTKTARDNTPEAHMILAAHGPGRSVASGSMTINRTENGLEEYLEMTVLPLTSNPPGGRIGSTRSSRRWAPSSSPNSRWSSAPRATTTGPSPRLLVRSPLRWPSSSGHPVSVGCGSIPRPLPASTGARSPDAAVATASSSRSTPAGSPPGTRCPACSAHSTATTAISPACSRPRQVRVRPPRPHPISVPRARTDMARGADATILDTARVRRSRLMSALERGSASGRTRAIGPRLLGSLVANSTAPSDRP